MRAIGWVLLLCGTAACGQPSLLLPRAGCLVDAGRFTPVLGVAGNFILGKTEQGDVLAAACASSLTLLKTERALLARDERGRTLGEWPLPGVALLSISPSGTQAVLHLPASREWYRTDGFTLELLAMPPEGGEALAIALGDNGEIWVLERETSGIWRRRISLAGQRMEEDRIESLPSPFLLLPNGTLLSAESLPPGASSPAVAMTRMGDDWVEVRTGHGRFALRWRAPDKTLYRLPEGEP